MTSVVIASVGRLRRFRAKNISIDAGNVFRKPTLDTDNIKGTTGGLVSGANAESTTTISFDTTVNVGDSVQLTGQGTESDPGEFALRALNDITGKDSVSFITGGALSGAGAFSTIKTSLDRARVSGGDFRQPDESRAMC